MKTHIRQKFVGGNWKMHTTAFEAEQLAKGVIDGLAPTDHVTVILCPPFPYLALVGDMLKGSNVVLGAQNMYPETEGAFTGEVSPTMLLDLGCTYVILGHSERRHKLGESDEFINRKVACALAAGLEVILCVGETLEQRKSRLYPVSASHTNQSGRSATKNIMPLRRRLMMRICSFAGSSVKSVERPGPKR
jgi:triosephosphate isomerase